MPVRIAHWIIFFSILVLSFTGYYMYNPFIISRGNGVFLMAKMRFIHEVTAFVFIAAVAGCDSTGSLREIDGRIGAVFRSIGGVVEAWSLEATQVLSFFTQTP